MDTYTPYNIEKIRIRKQTEDTNTTHLNTQHNNGAL
jgi:hypothetical protein